MLIHRLTVEFQTQAEELSDAALEELATQAEDAADLIRAIICDDLVDRWPALTFTMREGA